MNEQVTPIITGPRNGEQAIIPGTGAITPLAIDRLPGTLQRSRHPPAAVEWGPQELLVDQPHQRRFSSDSVAGER